ncbi:MAG TPA: hypothetical protein VH560_00470 [Polyangia bacterium]|jgi:hypothetical protein|nr:hypothetical protein [Polyangia bacterium]
MLQRRLDLWLPTYLAMAAQRLNARRRRREQTTHVMFLVCDHFEPRHDATDAAQPAARVRQWRERYTALQDRCRREFGHAPVHTWFYPPHHGSEHLPALAEFQFEGLGEIELHYHHDGDTSETLRRDLRATLAEYHTWGLLLESGVSPRTAFGFIHGDWALDNSGNGKFCGVDDELTILQELGCWGDLTMPSANECQTRKINSVYYAIDDPVRPKSHDWGVDAQVGRRDPRGLFMMQGPLAINWRAPGYPRIENSTLTTENWGRPDRIACWLDCNVHVRDKPQWLFVKLHAHGAVDRDFDALIGERAYQMHKTLNEQYNDGVRYRLHYVTAREAFNIAKAAERGCEGDPSSYRDLVLAPNATRYYWASAAHRLIHCTPTRVALEPVAPSHPCRVRLRGAGVAEITGAFASLDVDEAFGEGSNEASKRVRLGGCALGSTLAVVLAPGATIVSARGARAENAREGAPREVTLTVEAADVVLAYRRDLS